MDHSLMRLAFTLLAAFLAAQSVAAQEPGATFTSDSQLVVLHVAVRERNGGYVANLDQESFRVFENKRQQSISFFNSQDAPVTLGLLVDGSGSMAPHRDNVIAASMAFTRAMNPRDEFFALGFNEKVHAPLPPDKPFTQHDATLRVALVQASNALGQTAIYDAVSAGVRYVRKGQFERQVLIVLSDGGDNASSTTRRQVLEEAQASNALIYTIALVDPQSTEADPGFLRQLAEATGGLAFKPDGVTEIDGILQTIARDIRSMYTIGYVPPEASASVRAQERLRRVSVDVRLATGKKLNVRTRRAYLADGPDVGPIEDAKNHDR
jgi:VWFA-related protein